MPHHTRLPWRGITYRTMRAGDSTSLSSCADAPPLRLRCNGCHQRWHRLIFCLDLHQRTVCLELVQSSPRRPREVNSGLGARSRPTHLLQKSWLASPAWPLARCIGLRCYRTALADMVLSPLWFGPTGACFTPSPASQRKTLPAHIQLGRYVLLSCTCFKTVVLKRFATRPGSGEASFLHPMLLFRASRWPLRLPDASSSVIQ